MDARKKAVGMMESDLMDICVLRTESIQVITDHVLAFPIVEDYSLAQHGCTSYQRNDCKNFFVRAGYRTATRWTDSHAWSKYLEICGTAVRNILKRHYNITLRKR